jgi:FKBP-type peptidyl-prolyl cis-trans isomerase
MKSPAHLFAVGMLAPALALAFCTPLTIADTSPSPATTPDNPTFSDQQILQTWGWLISRQKEVDHIDISDAELAVFQNGLQQGFAGQLCPSPFDQVDADIDRLAHARRANFVQALIRKNQADTTRLFQQLDQNPAVQKLPSGDRCQILTRGSGPRAKPQQTVNVHFIGHLLDGREFTQTGPIDLVLWPSRFNTYLYEAIQTLSKGASARIFVSTPPSDQEVNMYGISHSSIMVFDIDLLDIKPTPPQDLELALLPMAPVPDPSPPSGLPQAQIIQAWGWKVGFFTPVRRLGFTNDERAQIARGLSAGIRGTPSPCDLTQINPIIQQFLAGRRQKAAEAFQRQQETAATTFFADLKKNPNVIQSPSGLCYQIINPGSGSPARPGKTVIVKFTGRLLDGSVFDSTSSDDTSSWALHNPRGSWPISGVYEGLQKISKGGKVKLFIPSNLAFGQQGNSQVPAYSAIIDEIELVDITGTPPPATQP